MVSSSSSFTGTIAIQDNSFVTAAGEYGWHLSKIHAQEAWNFTTESDSITVAVIDSGISFNHSELVDACWVNTDEIANNSIDDDGNGYVDDTHGWDFVSIDNTPDNIPGWQPSDPIHWHATFIAGIITANIDGEGIVGVAPDVKIMDLRVLKDDNYAGTTNEELGEAIRYTVDNGADVISLSLQYYGSDPAYYDDIVYAIDHNIPVISITGNTWVSDGGGREYKSYPGGYEEVISVGATNYYDEKADYSNYGSWTDIVAPVGDEEFDDYDHVLKSTNYNGESFFFGVGTSFACPQVAATVALMKSVMRNITVDDVKEILFQTATDLGDSGKDDYFGYGMLNTAAAVQETYNRKMGTTPPSTTSPPTNTQTNETDSTDITTFTLPIGIGIMSLCFSAGLIIVPVIFLKKRKK
jgi:hypothetical protein